MDEHQKIAVLAMFSEDIDRLVGEPSELVPIQVIPQRREFFKYLILCNYQQGVQLTGVPLVSKLNVDLHRLYISVRRRGGFKQVLKDKAWKLLCTEANPQISESSAAGYQLRLIYEKHLLYLECKETEQNYEELKRFIQDLRKPKKRARSKNPVGAGDASPVKLKKFSKVKAETSDETAIETSVEDDSTIEQDKAQALAAMAKNFKTRRNTYNYSQKEAAESICGVFQTDMSQTTISRFETCKLSARNMETVRELLDEWVEKVEEAHAGGKSYVEFLKESKKAAKEEQQ
ncbi:ARID/BRIGHT DNA binding domain protein [Aphelenchoides bicaudatus]|nr:ARID/BRIGHT DNA binding domain protein [Aphelenchoides bicaudatus]